VTSELDFPAVVLAMASALIFAVANNLQRGAASVVPLEVGGPIRLVLRLFRAPLWLFGSLLAVGALGLHAVALGRGGVIVVQAVMAAGLIAALAIEAFQEHRRMRPNELGGSVLLVAGVTMVLGWGRPGSGRPVDLRAQLLAGLLVLLVGGFGLVVARRWHHLRFAAVVMGGCGGACYALDAVFLKGLANSADDLDLLPVAVNLGGFLVASSLGNLVVQRGFQVAPLRLVLPAVTAGDPLVAFAVGRWLLNERLQGGAWATGAVTAGLVAIAVGIVVTTSGSSTAAGLVHDKPQLGETAEA
jgi:hypothetical protein